MGNNIEEKKTEEGEKREWKLKTGHTRDQENAETAINDANN